MNPRRASASLLVAIADLVPVSHSFSEIYHHLGTAWCRHRQQKNSVWQNRLKTWHNWQRDRLD